MYDDKLLTFHEHMSSDEHNICKRKTMYKHFNYMRTYLKMLMTPTSPQNVLSPVHKGSSS